MLQKKEESHLIQGSK